MFETDDEARLDPFPFAVGLDPLKSAHQLAKECLLRPTGQVGPQAEVLPDPKSNMTIGVARDVELVRVLEDFSIAIG